MHSLSLDAVLDVITLVLRDAYFPVLVNVKVVQGDVLLCAKMIARGSVLVDVYYNVQMVVWGVLEVAISLVPKHV